MNLIFKRNIFQITSHSSLLSLFTCFLSCLLSLTTKLAFFGFLSSTKMAFRKSLTWVPTFLVILLLASIPFLQSSRTRELVSSLSLGAVFFYILLMHIFTIQCVQVSKVEQQCQKTQPNWWDRYTYILIIKTCQRYHFYNQKDTIFASFLSLSYLSNVYPLHEMVFL